MIRQRLDEPMPPERLAENAPSQWADGHEWLLIRPEHDGYWHLRERIPEPFCRYPNDDVILLVIRSPYQSVGVREFVMCLRKCLEWEHRRHLASNKYRSERVQELARRLCTMTEVEAQAWAAFTLLEISVQNE